MGHPDLKETCWILDVKRSDQRTRLHICLYAFK
jgi:hypothetical protein